MLSVIDAHSHLAFFSGDLTSLLKKGEEQGIHAWVQGGYDSRDWKKQIAIAKAHPEKIMKCFGLHPWVVHSQSEESLLEEWESLNQLISQCDFVGELGLDFHRAKSSAERDKQKAYFVKQLELSGDKPRVLHVVQAHSEALALLKKYPGRGFVHGFSGSFEVAQSYIDLGYMISVGPGITKSGFTKLKEAAAALPLEALVLESDAPAEPDDSTDPVAAFFTVAQAFAELRGVDRDELLGETTKNLQSLLA